jgi:hypothetical protein
MYGKNSIVRYTDEMVHTTASEIFQGDRIVNTTLPKQEQSFIDNTAEVIAVIRGGGRTRLKVRTAKGEETTFVLAGSNPPLTRLKFLGEHPPVKD